MPGRLRAQTLVPRPHNPKEFPRPAPTCTPAAASGSARHPWLGQEPGQLLRAPANKGSSRAHIRPKQPKNKARGGSLSQDDSPRLTEYKDTGFRGEARETSKPCQMAAWVSSYPAVCQTRKFHQTVLCCLLQTLPSAIGRISSKGRGHGRARHRDEGCDFLVAALNKTQTGFISLLKW